jgi:hypothetical protein
MVKEKGWSEEVEEAGLVNKHIFWRSAGGTTLEDRDMNSYDGVRHNSIPGS